MLFFLAVSSEITGTRGRLDEAVAESIRDFLSPGIV
jgi:hypothetical protein